VNDPAPLRRNRDFVLLQSGQLLSAAGSQVASIAYPLLVLALTHSPAKAGIVGFATLLPGLLVAPTAGSVVDHVDRTRLMIVSDVVRAAALGALAASICLLLLVHTRAELWLIYVAPRSSSWPS